MRVFFHKNIEKKHLCHYDKNYFYFCKSNIPVTNLTGDTVKHEFRVESLKARAEVQKCEFKSNPRVASSNPRVASSNPRVANSNPRVTSSNPQVTSSNPQVTSSNPRVTRSNPRVQ